MTIDPKSCFFIVGQMDPDLNSLNNAGPIPVVFEEQDRNFYRCVYKGRELPVYILADGRRKMDSFPAFWCPYNDTRLGWTALTGIADYMFTATMDGCSFGIGHAAKDGTVIVGHVNSNHLQTPDSTKAMEKDQKLRLRALLSTGRHKPKVFEPQDYRYRKGVREVSATTFGVREKGKWHFYAHRWVKDYSGMAVTFEYLGLTKIK